MLPARSLAVSLALALSAEACASSGSRPAAPRAEPPAIEATFRAKCGACHVRIEPGSHARDALEAALRRHRARTHLTEAQWVALVDYLAAPAADAPRTATR